jgi:hypothetical protein
MKFLSLFLLLLFVPGQQQTAPTTWGVVVSDISTVQGFLNICRLEPDEYLAEARICVAYATGLAQGWEEGHVYGIFASHLANGMPADLGPAIESMSSIDRHKIVTAGERGNSCIPNSVTVGQIRDTLIRYARTQIQKTPSLGNTPISHMVQKALFESFPCPSSPPAKK